jgi:hypothetical protein
MSLYFAKLNNAAIPAPGHADEGTSSRPTVHPGGSQAATVPGDQGGPYSPQAPPMGISAIAAPRLIARTGWMTRARAFARNRAGDPVDPAVRETETRTVSADDRRHGLCPWVGAGGLVGLARVRRFCS